MRQRKEKERDRETEGDRGRDRETEGGRPELARSSMRFRLSVEPGILVCLKDGLEDF